MFRYPFLIILFSWLTLASMVQPPGATAIAAPGHPNTIQPASESRSVTNLPAEDAGATYLNKLFGNFGSPGRNTAGASNIGGPLEWFLVIFGTIVYGQIVLFVVLWILFTADFLGIIVGLLIIAISVNFILRRKPRAIALFVLACVNFILGSAITTVVAFTEGVPTVLISLIPLGALVWLALRQVAFQFKAIVKP